MRNRCERCRKKYEAHSTEDGLSTITGVKTVSKIYENDMFKGRADNYTIELCPECMQSFEEWLEEGDKNG